MTSSQESESPRKDVDFSPGEFPLKTWNALLLVGGAILVGAVMGLLGVGFLFVLHEGVALRNLLVGQMAKWPLGCGWLVLSCLASGAAAGAAWMVKNFAPTAVGSGVPYVERILRTDEQPRHKWVLPAKFVGGALALSAGMVLGREGPMVQMGAVVGEKIGRVFSGIQNAWKPLMAAGAGAGLATAFNAPVGGTIFILEEVLRKVTPLSFILAATSSTAAIFIQRAIFHIPRNYNVPALIETPAAAIWIFTIFGAVVGLCGVGYNRLIIYLLSSRLCTIPVVARAALIGFGIGALLWIMPQWMGEGDEMTQTVLNGRWEAWLFLALATFRFFIGPLCYAAGTPGGLFAPIIALGALLGSGAGHLQHALTPELFPSPVTFAVVGMAAFFTATVRAPLTGIIICLEMTGCYSLFFPMLSTCLGAYLIPTLLKNQPIYDELANFQRSSDLKPQ